MLMRSPIQLAIVLAVIAACGGVAPRVSTPVASLPSATSQATPTSQPTPTSGRTATPTVSSTPAGPPVDPIPTVTHNDDGSIWIEPSAIVDFIAPGSDGGIWGIVQNTRRHIVRIDAETYEIRAVVQGLPILPDPISPVVANGSIWLGSWNRNTITQYDAQTGELIREIEVGTNPIEPAVAYGDVWSIDHNGDSLTRIDVSTGAATTVEIPNSHPLWIAPAGEELMLAGGPTRLVYAIDPRTNEVLGSYEPAECWNWRAQIGDEFWVDECETDRVLVVDPRTGQLLDTFESPALPYPPLEVDGALWMPFSAQNGPGTFGLVGIDLATHEEVGRWERPASIREGSVFADFGGWWRWGWEGLLRVPADTLLEAVQ